MKDDFKFQPVHAYFVSASASMFFFMGILYEWPPPVLGALTTASLIFLGIGLGMTAFDIIRFAKSRKGVRGGDSIDN